VDGHAVVEESVLEIERDGLRDTAGGNCLGQVASGMVSHALRAARPAAQASRTGRAGVSSVIVVPPFVGRRPVSPRPGRPMP
jgi:hypothetical protein